MNGRTPAHGRGSRADDSAGRRGEDETAFEPARDIPPPRHVTPTAGEVRSMASGGVAMGRVAMADGPSSQVASIDSSLLFGGSMAQLIVRNVDDDLVQRLKQRAAQHGRSAEEEHRHLLRAALRSEGLISRLREMPDVGSDDDFARATDLPRDIDL